MFSRILQTVADIGLRASSARNALQHYRRITAAGVRLSAADQRRALTDSSDQFGSLFYAPWLLLYSAVRGGFTAGWIPASFYATKVERVINRPRDAGSATSLAARIVSGAQLPDLAYVINGRGYNRNLQPLDDRQLYDLLFDGRDQVIAKTDGAHAVTLLHRTEYQSGALRQLQGNLVLQQYLQQHPAFDGYSAGGASLRLTTVCAPDGSVSIRAADVRLAAPGQPMVRTINANRVPLDPHDGTAVDDALQPDWLRLTHHPTSGLRFRDLAVPGWPATLQHVLEQHRRLPHFGCIGWDVLIDAAEQPWILTWHTHSHSIAFAEASTGPCFRGLNWEIHARRRG